MDKRRAKAGEGGVGRGGGEGGEFPHLGQISILLAKQAGFSENIWDTFFLYVQIYNCTDTSVINTHMYTLHAGVFGKSRILYNLNEFVTLCAN
jgi:hypothetical protein